MYLVALIICLICCFLCMCVCTLENAYEKKCFNQSYSVDTKKVEICQNSNLDCFPHRMDKTIFNVENKLKIHLKAIKDITITRPLM